MPRAPAFGGRACEAAGETVLISTSTDPGHQARREAVALRQASARSARVVGDHREDRAGARGRGPPALGDREAPPLRRGSGSPHRDRARHACAAPRRAVCSSGRPSCRRRSSRLLSCHDRVLAGSVTLLSSVTLMHLSDCLPRSKALTASSSGKSWVWIGDRSRPVRSRKRMATATRPASRCSPAP